MNLGRHLSVMWRFRALTAAGLLLGLVLAVLASYQVSLKGSKVSFNARGVETWSSMSSILVTQSGFPWGRVTLGTSSAPNLPAAPPSKDPNVQEFADPGRFSNLAMLYSVISYSDSVRQALREKPTADQIVAVPWDATGNGTTFLPIVRLTTTASTAEGARQLNFHAADALRNLLTSEQRANQIPNRERVKLNVLNAPSAPTLVRGRSHTASILAFTLIILCTIALAHILEAVRPRRVAVEVRQFAWNSAPASGMDDETPAPAVSADEHDAGPARVARQWIR